jgi:hypothetical protein
MKRVVLMLAVAVGIGAAGAARADGSGADLTGRMLAALHAGADCANKASPMRPWCVAADGWATAKMAPLPKARVLVGITVTLVDGGVVATELRDKVTLSALALRDDAAAAKAKKTFVKLTSVTPTAGKDDEALAIMKAVGGVSMVLKGKAKQVGLPPELAEYVATLPAGASYEVAKAASGQGWSWNGASAGEIRKVGASWVVIETMVNGVYVTVLTDKL